MTEEKIGELFFEIKSDSSKLKAELAALKDKVNKDGKDIDKKLSFKARFDNGIAKLRLSELQKYRQKLQLEFDKKVSLNVDAASLDRTRQKLASVDSQLGGVGKSATSMGANIMKGLAAFGGIAAIFSFLKKSVGEYIESSIAMAKITRAVETTGKAAGYSATQLSQMAKDLQKLTSIDNDTILTNVTNNLLTFKAVSGDVFKKAQNAILDLNAVIANGEVSSLTSQTIQLGKALNNPIQGISALTRVGISFSAEQKEQIKNLVKQNQLYEAQTIILDEIEGQYGGQAEVLALADGGFKKLNQTINDIAEAIGEDLVGSNNAGTSSLQEAADSFLYLNDAAKDATGGLGIFGTVWENLMNVIQPGQGTLKRLFYNQQVKDAKDKLQADLKESIKKTKEFYKELGISPEPKPNKIITPVMETGAGDEVLNNLYEESNKLSEINNKLKDTTLSEEERNALLKARKNLLETDSTSTSKTKVVFESSIPKGYTAEQVAEFENLKFAVKGYVDFRRELIELTYQQEKERAQNNAVDIQKAEENKLLSTARLNQEIIELDKETGRKILDESIKNTERLNDESDKDIEREKDKLKEKEKAYENFYDNIQQKSEDYFSYKIGKIQEEAALLLEATGDPVIAKQLELEQLKSLEQEYFDWRMEQWFQQQGILGEITKVGLEGISAAYDTMWQTITDSSLSGTERAQKIFESLKQTAIMALGDIVKTYIANWIKSSIIGDSFRAVELSKGIAMGSSLASAYAPAAAFASTMSFGGAAVAGGAALASTVALAELLSVPKFANGTNGFQKVPEGFSNDSYPIMMQSGEDFRVRTPAQQNSDEARMTGIEKRLDILNANLVSKDFNPTIHAGLSIDGKSFAKKIISVINTMEKEGTQLGNF